MHGRAFEHRGIPGEYTNHTTSAEGLAQELEGLLPDYHGLNITHPLKAKVLAYCSEVSPLAVRLAAANTLVRVGSSWRGENTDAPGLLRVLGGPGAPGEKVALVLGAGGAARATIWALGHAGYAHIQVRCRQEVAFQELQCRGLTDRATLSWLPWDAAAGPVDLVINSTPLGRHLDLPLNAKTPRVLDLNYRPKSSTQFCLKSRSKGLISQDGRALLLEQGLLAQELWFGDQPRGLRQAMAQELLE